MKNLLLAFSLGILFPYSCLSQLQNGGFENWTNQGTFIEPDHWFSLNYVSFPLGSSLVCEQGSPGNPGSYYAKLTTRDIPGFGPLTSSLTSGEYDNTSGRYTQGFPFSQRPADITGNWQYVPIGGDGGYVAVILSKWNTALASQDIIATTYYMLPGTQVNWTNFSVPLTYISADLPDTAVIIFASSGATGATPIGGSSLSIDNIGFSGTVSEVAENNSLPVYLFPNPAHQFINVSGQLVGKETNYNIISLNGKSVQNGTLDSKTNRIEFNNLSKGNYFLLISCKTEHSIKRLVIE